jgi:hypothetical protein
MNICPPCARSRAILSINTMMPLSCRDMSNNYNLNGSLPGDWSAMYSMKSM